jgi:glycerophosphoryl diester phosphodiesterase
MVAVASTSAAAFDLQGHRGTRGLAPENTIAAFTTALSLGVTTLELDLAMTKDGVLVVHHDPWLNPDTTRDADGRFLTRRGPAIHALTLAEVKRYDVGRLKPGTAYAVRYPQQRPADGERIPALTEVFELVRRAGAEHIRFNIETKITPTTGADTPSPGIFAGAVARAITEAGLTTRATVQSFDWRTLVALREIAPAIERICLTAELPELNTLQRGRPGPSPWTAGLDLDDFGGSTPRLVVAAGCSVWSPYFRDLAPDALAQAKALKTKVIPWTVNEKSDMDRLIGLGVDGIISDYPDRLRAVMAARGMPLPAPVFVR